LITLKSEAEQKRYVRKVLNEGALSGTLSACARAGAVRGKYGDIEEMLREALKPRST
jgi:hypothetical protein